MKKEINQAARALAKERWKGVTEEEHRAHNRRIAKLPRSPRRCFCGATSMINAANRYFDCCRKAGVIVLNLDAKVKA